MLNFIGCGSAFNTSLGNNGAFIKSRNNLFMIDCGSSTFERIMKSNLLKDVDNISILLTHMHSDHVGSLGDLILYGFYSMGKIGEPNVHIFVPSDLDIKRFLKLVGVEENTYKITQFNNKSSYQYDNFYIEFKSIPVNHVKELSCYGYIIHYENKKIYYSGDSNEIPKDILNKLNNDYFDLFYQDTCKADYEGNVHLSLKQLNKLVDYKVRKKVYCMHIDNEFSLKEARELGFNVVQPYKSL